MKYYIINLQKIYRIPLCVRAIVPDYLTRNLIFQ